MINIQKNGYTILGFVAISVIVGIGLFYYTDTITNTSNTITTIKNPDVYSKNPMHIPKIIIQTWKTNSIPPKYKTLVDSLKTMNPDYEYKFFTDEDIDIFLQTEYPDYFKTYKALPYAIQRFDFFRYIAVYHFGGFYFDLDMLSLEPLDTSVLEKGCVFPIDYYLEPSLCVNRRFTYFCGRTDYLLGQYAFGAYKKHPFIKELIDGIHNALPQIVKNAPIQNVYNKQYYHLYIYQTTGPDYVTKTYLENEWDTKTDIYILPYPKQQFFGKYAEHKYYGTWK